MAETILLPPVVGLGHSALQVESEIDLDGRLVDHNWGRETRCEARTKYLMESGLADKYGLEFFQVGKTCEVDRLWAQDLVMFKDHGFNGLRCSVNWPRINPAPGAFDQRELQRITKMLDLAKDLDIKICLTFWHWDEPGWCDDAGSWETPTMVKHFDEFVRVTMGYVGDRTDLFTVLNEPTVFAMFTRRWFREGWPRQYAPRDDGQYFNMLGWLAEAHAHAAERIRHVNPNAKIGIAHASNWNASNIPELKEHWDDEQYNVIRMFQKVGGRHAFDFLGLNSYMLRMKNLGKPERASWDGYVGYCPEPVQSAPCEVATGKPWGMCGRASGNIALEYWDKFGLPIFITEHGYPTGPGYEHHQVWDTAEMFISLHEAMEDGAEIAGAFLWSALGPNFELGESFFADFGYFHVDRETKNRTARPAVEFIGDCVRAGGIDDAVRAKWGAMLERPKNPRKLFVP